MRTATDTADLVTADAQHLAGTVVAARARDRIAPGLAAVLVVDGTDPSRWMRAAAAIAGDSAIAVTARAAIGAVAGRARAGLGLGLERVAREEAGAVDTRRERIAEVERRRQHGGRLAMTLGAELLAMAALAQIPRRGGTRAVLARPVAVVDEVTARQGRRVVQVLVARGAHARVSLGLVRVAAVAGDHRGPQMVVAVGDAGVAAHAVPARGPAVARVIES